MKKQIILYIIKTAIPIEIIFMLAVVIICQETKDFSKYWLILLEFQIPTVCIVAFSTIAFHESYLNEIDDLRLQEKLNEIKKEMESNKEFMDCWNEFKKESGETMGKYIRTEKGIYKVSEKATYCGKNFYYTTAEVTLEDIDIVEEADTIEELCDGFYNDILNDFDCFGFDGLYIYNDFESFKNDWNGYRTHDNWEGDGYGFIKSSKGLIYVAKLNDEGVLELI